MTESVTESARQEASSVLLIYKMFRFELKLFVYSVVTKEDLKLRS